MNNAKMRKEIERNNRLYRSSTPAQKRVLVAKDVISLQKKQRIAAHSGQWFMLSEYPTIKQESCSLQEALHDGSLPTCLCCGIGSVLAAGVHINNKVTVREAVNTELQYDRIVDGLEDRTGMVKLFGKKRLAMIEIAFELGGGFYDTDPDSWSMGGDSGLNPKLVDRLIKFGKRYPIDDKARLTAIMKNIVKNRGEFVP